MKKVFSSVPAPFLLFNLTEHLGAARSLQTCFHFSPPSPPLSNSLCVSLLPSGPPCWKWSLAWQNMSEGKVSKSSPWSCSADAAVTVWRWWSPRTCVLQNPPCVGSEAEWSKHLAAVAVRGPLASALTLLRQVFIIHCKGNHTLPSDGGTRPQGSLGNLNVMMKSQAGNGLF